METKANDSHVSAAQNTQFEKTRASTTMYRQNLRQLPPVADADANRRMTPARTVVADTPADNALLYEAVVESRARSAAIASRQAVTIDEELAAKKRELALMLEHVAIDYPAVPLPGNIAPPWFRQAMRANQRALANLRNAMTAGLRANQLAMIRTRREMRRGFRDVTERLENIQANTASLVESQKQARNSMIYKRSREDSELLDTPLSVYSKMHDGLGGGHPGGPNVAPADVPRGHLLPSPPFPETLRDLKNMTLANVKELSMLMHNTFGINGRDRLEKRITKVRKHLLYRV